MAGVRLADTCNEHAQSQSTLVGKSLNSSGTLRFGVRARDADDAILKVRVLLYDAPCQDIKVFCGGQGCGSRYI